MRAIRARWYIVPILGLFLGLAALARADVTVTTVSLEGRVEFRDGTRGKWQPVFRGTRLRQAAFIRTYQNASVVLKVGDRGVVTIHEMSTVIISNLAGTDAVPQSRLELLVGKVWAKFKKDEEMAPVVETAGQTGATEVNAAVGKKPSFSIGTPAAVASVRGTAFYVESDQQTKNSRVGVWEGVVAVSGNHAARNEAAKNVEAGFEIVVLYNKPLIDPRKMEIERIRSEQNFNQQMQDLGLAAVLGGRGIAEGNKILIDEAETTIKDANLNQRGEKIVRDDFEKFKTAIAKLYSDTGFIPGEGFNVAAGKKSLICLTENNNGRDEQIENWKGPYMDTDFKDPFGGEYGCYQQRTGNSSVLMLVSLGLDKVVSNDDVKLPYTRIALERAAEAFK